MYPYMGMSYGVDHADGLVGIGMGLKDHFLWTDRLASADPETRFRILKRSNVKFWINLDHLVSYSGEHLIRNPDRMKVFADALPRAFLVPRARHVGAGRVLDVYYSETFDPLQEVLLDKPMDFEPSPSFTGEVEDILYQPNRVEVHTRQVGDGFLVLLDSWFPGWTVTVDGQPGQILRANHFFRAVRLGPGDHRLIFEFTPEGWTLGLWVSGTSLGAILLLSLWVCRRPPVEALKSPSSPENVFT